MGYFEQCLDRWEAEQARELAARLARYNAYLEDAGDPEDCAAWAVFRDKHPLK